MMLWKKHVQNQARLLWGWLLLLCCCQSTAELSFAPKSHSSTLGHDVFIVLCEHAAALDHPMDVSGLTSYAICHQGEQPDGKKSPRLKILTEAKQPLIRTINTNVDQQLQYDIQGLIEQTLPLVEQGILPQASQAIAEWIDQLTTREQALQALAYIYGQQGYVPPPWQANVSQGIFHYPQLPSLMQITLESMYLSPTIQEAWRQWLASMHVLLREQPTSSATSQSLQHWLLHEHQWPWQPQSLLVAKRDHRGLVRPSLNAGKLAGPFVDQDGDGLADIDRLGRFINHQGKRLQVPTPLPAAFEQEDVRRDKLGRAIAADAPLYEYRHLHKTLLADLLKEMQLMQRAGRLPLVELLASLRSALGAAEPVGQQEGITLWAHQTEDSLLFTMAEPLLALLQTPQVSALLQLLKQTIQDHPSLLTEWLTWWQQISLPPTQGAAQLNHRLELWQALAAHMQQLLARPLLLQELIEVLSQPERDDLGQILAQHMRYKDTISIPARQSLLSEPRVWRELVDHHRADDWDNRSLMQRLLYLIDNTTDAKICNRAGAHIFTSPWISLYPIHQACAGFSVDNMAKFYLQSIVRDKQAPHHGKAFVQVHDPYLARTPDSLWNQLLPSQSDIPGFGRYPTTPAVNRSLFAPPNSYMQQLIDPAVGRDGRLLQDAHRGDIFAWEQLGFYDAIRPVLQVYGDADEEDLALELFGILHRFWGQHHGNLRSLEPIASYWMGEARGLYHTGKVLQRITQSHIETSQGRQSGTQVLHDVLQVLFQQQPTELLASLPPLRTTAESVAVPQTLADWLWNARINLEIWQAELPPMDWQALLRTTLALHQKEDGTIDWHHPTLKSMVQHLCQLIQSMQPAPDLKQALFRSQQQLIPWRQLAARPFIYSSLQLIQEMAAVPALRDEVENFLLDILDESNGRASRDGIMVLLSQLLEVHGTDALLQPLIQAVAPLFDPNKGPIALSTHLFHVLAAYDPAQVTPRLLAAFSNFVPKQQGLLWQHMLKIWLAINRLDPNCDQPLSQEDWQHILLQLQQFLIDEEHGLERLYTILRHR